MYNINFISSCKEKYHKYNLNINLQNYKLCNIKVALQIMSQMQFDFFLPNYEV